MRFGALLGSRGIASRAGMLRIFAVLVVVGASFGIWRATTQAVDTTTLALSPATKVQLYYNATPFTETLNLTNATNVAGYQFRLTWNPNKIQWVSSDLATLGPTWLGSTGRGPLCSIIYDATPSPTGTPPTLTPTNTPAVPTATRTPTATPAGNITFGCASLGTPGQIGLPQGPNVGATPRALANFNFKSIAVVEASDQLQLTNVGVVNALSTPAVVVSTNATIRLVGCHDMDGDGVISILDLSKVAAHFGSTIAVPTPLGWIWLPLYDTDSDGSISILDLASIAAGFGLTCA